ncbi:MAG: hypothetical protein PVH88_02100 [Ignavibacteria bacterium]
MKKEDVKKAIDDLNGMKIAYKLELNTKGDGEIKLNFSTNENGLRYLLSNNRFSSFSKKKMNL